MCTDMAARYISRSYAYNLRIRGALIDVLRIKVSLRDDPERLNNTVLHVACMRAAGVEDGGEARQPERHRASAALSSLSPARRRGDSFTAARARVLPPRAPAARVAARALQRQDERAQRAEPHTQQHRALPAVGVGSRRRLLHWLLAHLPH